MDIVYISVLVYVNIESLAWLESTLPYAIYLFLSLVLRYLYLPLVLIQCNFLIHNFLSFFCFFIIFSLKSKKFIKKYLILIFSEKKNDFLKKTRFFLHRISVAKKQSLHVCTRIDATVICENGDELLMTLYAATLPVFIVASQFPIRISYVVAAVFFIQSYFYPCSCFGCAMVVVMMILFVYLI